MRLCREPARLNQRSQLALDKMSKEIRQARQLTAFSTNSLTFANADGNPLSFTYTPGTPQTGAGERRTNQHAFERL